jgi:hypothetical protein
MSYANPSTGSAAPQVTLNVRRGPGAGQSYTAARPTIIVGRGAGNDVVIDDGQVSRRHASITWDGQQYIVQDLGSANGTYVNGMLLSGPRVLQQGDSIGLGQNIVLGFQMATPVYAAPPPAPAGMAYSAPAPAAVKKRSLLLPILLGLAGVLALLLAVAAAAYFLLQQQPTPSRMVVLINAPRQGDQVTVGQTVMVHSVARDEGKVSRVELWADGQMVASQNSSLSGGTSPFPLVARWAPSAPGNHTLTAIAYNPGGGKAQASIVVEALDNTDRDGDGVPDAADASPDEAGAIAAAGSPDRDGDGIADAEDTCPDEAGLPEALGCPAPAEGDLDGDGVLDSADMCLAEAGSPDADGCPDADGDGVADAADACPAEPGLGDDGCPADGDSDSDGVPDAADACPDVPGSPAADGCPDADGDGIIDSEDACPGEVGPVDGGGCPIPADGDRDGDSIPDSEDACPDEPGPPWSGGCPAPGGADLVPAAEDRDGDSVPDDADACPDEWGPAEHDGCPDRDGDGVLDREDLCPDIFGEAIHSGCPAPPGGADSDGDGIVDMLDMCPLEPGPIEHGGCPPVVGIDSDGDGIPDIEEAPEDEGGIPLWPPPGGADWGDDLHLMSPVEVQILSFTTSHDLDQVSCYVSLGGADRERFDAQSAPGRQWVFDAGLQAPGGAHVAVPMGDPLTVLLDCGGEEIFLNPGGGWGTYWDLGAVATAHPPEEWDGREHTVGSDGGDDGRSFQATYRLCEGTCEGLLEPPTLILVRDQISSRLRWNWAGDRETIDGFKVYLDGSHIFSVDRDLSHLVVDFYAPPCGSEPIVFQVSAFSGDTESPMSNGVTWIPEACPRTVMVTFESISAGALGDDEWWAHGHSVGPIYGHFWVTGADSKALVFNATDPGNRWGERDEGLRLRHHTDVGVQGIFDWIHREMAECIGAGCPSYSAPESASVEVPLGPDDDLTISGLIMDLDGNADDTLFEGQVTIASEDVEPGRYTLRDRNIELSFWIDVVVGPEAGELPDLTITDVDLHGGPPGQLRIQVFNSAAPMMHENLTVRIVRRSTDEVLAQTTWRDITIPSGGFAPLQTLETFDTTGDLRVIVDPDNGIPEMNDGNNTYETPVRMRVEFLEARVPRFCNESAFNCRSEHVFHLWAGHGPDGGDIKWVGHNVRFPEHGQLYACTLHPFCEDDASPPEDWRMEGDPHYTFEFEMPASDHLYVMVTGEEQDSLSMDDSLGDVFVEYAPDANWGAGSGVPANQDHAGSHGERTFCDEATCDECPDGLSARWRIYRVE